MKPHISLTKFLDTLIILKGVMMGVLLVIGIVGLNHLSKLGKTNNTLTEQVKILAQQVKSLSAENQSISQENKDLATQIRQQQTCFFKAFAIFTQTYQPVTLEQIQSCSVSPTSSTSATSNTSGTAASPQSSKVSVFSSQPKPTTTPQQSQSNNSQPPSSPKTGLIKQIIKFLGL